MTIQVVLADNHPIVLTGLESLLRAEPDIQVVGRCGTSTDAVRLIRASPPDVVLLDGTLGGGPLTGLDIVREFRADSSIRFVLLNNSFDEATTVEALRAGVRGMLVKAMAPDLIVRCIRKVHGGGRWIERDSYSDVLDHLLAIGTTGGHPRSDLSAREVEVAKLAAAGFRNREISGKLAITEGTVKLHLHRVFGKLQIGSRTELAVRAREYHLV